MQSTDTSETTDQLSVNIRMYCHGLGDCFLLTFQKEHKVYRMLIDCGILQRTADEKKVMEIVAQDILDQLHSKTIDLVVATHEHHDHICGFAHAANYFDEMTFKEIWVAWTEDPNNELAQSLQKSKFQTLTMLSEAVNQMKGFNKKAGERVENLMVSFYGESFNLAENGETLPAGKPKKRAAGLKYLLETKASEQKTKPKYTYCYPGRTPLSLQDFEEDVRIYVLGPPCDKSKLRDLNAPSVEKYRHEFAEMLINDGFSMEESFFFALGEATDQPAKGEPFDAGFGIAKDDAETDDFFEEHYYGNRQSWRTIDGDWLSMTNELALKMDSYTNNTSLVLAIELIKSKKVLLFAADAQFGNWKSWHDYKWTITEKDGTRRRVNAATLLENTVLYKVGHHGSHNATLRKSGLNLMTHPELVALIPVDTARADKEEWEMPFGALLEDLMDKTNKRVFTSDKIPEVNDADKDWCRISVDEDNKLGGRMLFIDYKIVE